MASSTQLLYDDREYGQGGRGIIKFKQPYDAYRNLQFLKPTTGDLNTWLEANAVKMPLTGTWVFNETPTFSSNFRSDISFTSNGNSYTQIRLVEPKFSYLPVSGAGVVAYDSDADTWADSSYRTITFTQPVKYEGNEEFVRWFVDNAAPSSN